jgi:transposase
VGKIRTNIPKERWDSVKVCYLNGMHPKEIAKRFSIAENTVYTKIGKAGWYKIKKEAIAQEPQPQAIEELAQVLEEDWKSKGAAHRSMMYEIAHKALKSASLPAPRSWKDAQIADNIARKATGLDEEKGNTAVVNIGWMHGTIGAAPTRLENDVLDVEFERESVSDSEED